MIVNNQRKHAPYIYFSEVLNKRKIMTDIDKQMADKIAQIHQNALDVVVKRRKLAEIEGKRPYIVYWNKDVKGRQSSVICDFWDVKAV